MNILVVNNYYYPFEVGGAEESLRLQCEALVELGNKVSLITVNHSGKASDCNVNGVDVSYVKTFFRKGSPSNPNRSYFSRFGWQFGGALQLIFWFEFIRLVINKRPDVVYLNNLPGIGRFVVFLSKIFGLKVVVCLRDYAWVCLRQSKFNSEKKCTNLCVKCKVGTFGRRAISCKVDAVSANSAELLSTIQMDGAFKNIPNSVIYAGCDLQDPTFKKSDPQKKSSYIIGVMGQLIASKGFREFLSEVKPICESGVARVIVAGDISGIYAKNLVEEFSFEWVEFKGRMKRDDFFDSVDIVVIPSLWNEPLSRITYEAMARGKCLIASSNGGQKEILEHGKNGFIYNPGDGSLLKILDNILKNKELMRGVSVEAYSSASKYSPANAANRLLNLFKITLGVK